MMKNLSNEALAGGIRHSLNTLTDYMKEAKKRGLTVSIYPEERSVGFHMNADFMPDLLTYNVSITKTERL